DGRGEARLSLVEVAGKQLDRQQPAPPELDQRREERVAVLAARKADQPAIPTPRHAIGLDRVAGLADDPLAELAELRGVRRAGEDRREVGLIKHGGGLAERCGPHNGSGEKAAGQGRGPRRSFPPRRHGVVTGAAEGVAAPDAAERKPAAAQGAVNLERLERVGGAAWLEPAAMPEERREDEPVEPDRQGENAGGRAHLRRPSWMAASAERRSRTIASKGRVAVTSARPTRT